MTHLKSDPLEPLLGKAQGGSSGSLFSPRSILSTFLISCSCSPPGLRWLRWLRASAARTFPRVAHKEGFMLEKVLIFTMVKHYPVTFLDSKSHLPEGGVQAERDEVDLSRGG